MQNINYEFTLKEINKKSDKQRAYIQQLENQLEDQKAKKEKENLIIVLQDQIRTLQVQNEQEKVHNQLVVDKIQQQILDEQQLQQIQKVKINELEEKLIAQQNHHNGQLQSLNNEFQITKEEKETLQLKADEYLQQIQSLIQQVGLTQSQQQETQSKAQQMIEETNRNFQEKIQTQQKLIDKFKHQIHELEVTVEESNKQVHQLGVQLQKLQETEQCNIQLRLMVVNLQNELQQCQIDHKNYIAQREEQESRTCNERVLLKQQIINLDEKIIRNKKIQQNQYETIQTLYTQVDEVLRDQKNKEIAIQRLQNELVDKEKEKIALIADNENLKQALNDSNNQYQTLHSLIQESPIQSRISGGKSQVNSNKSQISENRQRSNFEKENEILKKQLVELRYWSENQIQELQFTLDQIQKQDLDGTLNVACQLIISKLNQIDFKNYDKELIQVTQSSIKDPIMKFFEQLTFELKKKEITLQYQII